MLLLSTISLLKQQKTVVGENKYIFSNKFLFFFINFVNQFFFSQ